MASWGCLGRGAMLAPALTIAVTIAGAEGLESLLAEESALARQADTVVTAARYSQRVDRTPSRVHVIPKSQIEAVEPKTVADLLRLVPGFTVLRRQVRGHEVSAFGVGGQFSNKVLIQVDGHRVTEPGFGNFLWQDLPVAVEDVDRIEVVLGPESTLHGTNAFAAVVNIRTGRLRDRGGSRVVVRGGNRGYRATSWLAARSTPEEYLGVSVEEEGQRGFGALVDGVGTPDAAFVRGEEVRRRSARVVSESALGSRSRLRVAAAMQESRLEHLPTAPGAIAELDGVERSHWLDLDFDHHLSTTRSFQVKGTWSEREREFSAAPLGFQGVAERDLGSGILDLELRYNQRRGPWRLVGGASLLEVSSSGYLLQPGDDDARSTSVFVQGEREFGDRFVLFAGSRMVFQDLGDDALSWKVAGLYRPHPDTALRLAIGTSFRQPDLISARLRTTGRLGATPLDRPLLTANPGLDNERARGFVQAGLERRWRDGHVGLDLYTARLDGLVELVGMPPAANLLTPAPVSSGLTPHQWQNSPDRLRLRGATLSFTEKLGELDLQLALNVQDVGGSSLGADAPYAPSRSGSVMLSRAPRGRRWGATLTWTGVGPYDVDRNALEDGASPQLPGYGLLDVHLRRRLSDACSLTLSAANVLDHGHREVLYTLVGDTREQGVGFGREFYLTVRWDL